jgi:hypothetical protein
MRITRYRPSPGTAIAITALVVAIGGVAYAAIPDSNGTIHGCYQKENGNLRVVASATDCKTNETAIQWNQQGPPGQSGNVHTFGDVRLSDGQSRVLVSEGPLTLTARCLFDHLIPPATISEFDVAEVLVSTTEDHAAFGGGSFENRDLLTTAPEEDRVLARALTGSNIPETGQNAYRSVFFSAAAPDGTQLSGVLDAGVRTVGSTGCVFGGYVVVG